MKKIFSKYFILKNPDLGLKLSNYYLLFFPILISSLLLFEDIPPWSYYLSLSFWLLRFILDAFNLKTVSKSATGFIAFITLILILIDFKTLLGKEAAVCFISILTGLKILEFTKDSEKDFIILLGFFLISSKFLFTYELYYFFISIPIYTLLCYHLFPTEWTQKNKRQSYLYLFKVFIFCIPFTILLFLIVPRITKSLEELPISGVEGQSGFSDSISPGSISKLALNYDIAFRVEFSKSQNWDIRDLYFKGLVLEKNKGLRWFSTSNKLKTLTNHTNSKTKLSTIDSINSDIIGNDQANDVSKPIKSTNFDFKINIEPTYRNHLFVPYHTLEVYSPSNNIDVFPFDTYKTEFIIEKRSLYFGKLPINAQPISIFKAQNQIEILSSSFKINNLSDIPTNDSKILIVSKILNYFKNGKFEYSLNTPDSGNLTLDDFLNKTKKGFCEHYASAMALILLKYNIPARVVIGYQGGEFNTNGNFWTIRQKDAHAWIEFLNETNEWVPIDPVQVVAPERYTGSENSQKTKKSGNQFISFFQNNWEILSAGLDYLNYKWSLFLLDSNFESQKSFLNNIKTNLNQIYKMHTLVKNLKPLLWLQIISILLITFASIYSIKMWHYYSRHQLSQLVFNEITLWCRKYHLEKNQSESPLEWKQRIISKLNQSAMSLQLNDKIKNNLDAVFQIWIQTLYSPQSTQEYSYFEKLKWIKKIKNSLRNCTQL